MIVPFCMTTIRSAALTVDRRCAIRMLVVFFQNEIQRLLDLPFGEGVNAGGRFIQNEDGGVLHQHAHQRHELTLPHRKPVAALADFGVQAFGQGLKPFAVADLFGELEHFLFGYAGRGVTDIIRDGA